MTEEIHNVTVRAQRYWRLLQSLIELSPPNCEERSLLESLSNHVQARGSVNASKMRLPFTED